MMMKKQPVVQKGLSEWMIDHHISTAKAVFLLFLATGVLVGVICLALWNAGSFASSSSSSPAFVGKGSSDNPVGSTGVAQQPVTLVTNNIFNNYPAVVQMFSATAGTASYTDSKGGVWVPDSGYSSNTLNGFGEPGSPTPYIAGAGSDQTLYLWSRYPAAGSTSFTYNILLTAGRTYIVTLLFAETYHLQTTPGQRVFSVSVNGLTTYANTANIDIVQRAPGPNTAYHLSIPGVTAPNGKLVLLFTGIVDLPQVQAIQVADCTGTTCT